MLRDRVRSSRHVLREASESTLDRHTILGRLQTNDRTNALEVLALAGGGM